MSLCCYPETNTVITSKLKNVGAKKDVHPSCPRIVHYLILSNAVAPSPGHYPEAVEVGEIWLSQGSKQSSPVFAKPTPCLTVDMSQAKAPRPVVLIWPDLAVPCLVTV